MYVCKIKRWMGRFHLLQWAVGPRTINSKAWPFFDHDALCRYRQGSASTMAHVGVHVVRCSTQAIVLRVAVMKKLVIRTYTYVCTSVLLLNCVVVIIHTLAGWFGIYSPLLDGTAASPAGAAGAAAAAPGSSSSMAWICASRSFTLCGTPERSTRYLPLKFQMGGPVFVEAYK